MQVRRFENAAEYYERVKPFLMTHEAAHCVMLGVCATLIQTGIYQQPPYLACVEDAGEIVAVAMRTPPHNLLLSVMADESPLQVIVQDVHALYSDLTGTVGLKAITKAFAQTWHNQTGQNVRLSIEERLYSLTRVIRFMV